ncbi:hypothetical protein B0I37DRAFT_381367 [Chaetomium sp. MPI-CAGE-AT-0009]|nr:hypothetical protein B0I37DRAFT_381367 [Chaetomium sp. MPI-CAGE-AT-0009]
MDDVSEIMASQTAVSALWLGKRNTLSGVAIGMTVFGCLIASLVIAVVLWLFCSTWGRRDTVAVQKTDAKPAKSTYGQPWINMELGVRETPEIQQWSEFGGFEQWKEQRDTRTKAQKEFKKQSRAVTTKKLAPPAIQKPLPTATRKPAPAMTRKSVSTERGGKPRT